MEENQAKFLHQHVVLDLEEFVNDHGHRFNGHEYILNCPLCAEHGFNGDSKLYIKADFSSGYCHRCKSVYHKKEKSFADAKVSEFETPNFNFDQNETFELDRINTDYYTYAKDFMEDEYNWLVHRNPMLRSIYKDFKFKFRKNKCIIPFFWNKDDLFYYQVRATLPRDKAPLAYFCPVIQHKPIWINPCNRGSKSLVITEGVFGAIGAWLMFNRDYDTISAQGSDLTEYQMWMLDHFIYDNYYIYYDEYELSDHIRKKLRKHNSLMYRKITVIKSKLGDPEDDLLGRSVVH